MSVSIDIGNPKSFSVILDEYISGILDGNVLIELAEVPKNEGNKILHLIHQSCQWYLKNKKRLVSQKAILDGIEIVKQSANTNPKKAEKIKAQNAKIISSAPRIILAGVAPLKDCTPVAEALENRLSRDDFGSVLISAEVSQLGWLSLSAVKYKLKFLIDKSLQKTISTLRSNKNTIALQEVFASLLATPVSDNTPSTMENIASFQTKSESSIEANAKGRTKHDSTTNPLALSMENHQNTILRELLEETKSSNDKTGETLAELVRGQSSGRKWDRIALSLGAVGLIASGLGFAATIYAFNNSASKDDLANLNGIIAETAKKVTSVSLSVDKLVGEVAQTRILVATTSSNVDKLIGEVAATTSSVDKLSTSISQAVNANREDTIANREDIKATNAAIRELVNQLKKQ